MNFLSLILTVLISVTILCSCQDEEINTKTNTDNDLEKLSELNLFFKKQFHVYQWPEVLADSSLISIEKQLKETYTLHHESIWFNGSGLS